MSVHPGLKCLSNPALSTGLRLEHEPLVFDCSPENGPLTRREAVVKLSAVEFVGGLLTLCRRFWHALAVARWPGEQESRRAGEQQEVGPLGVANENATVLVSTLSVADLHQTSPNQFSHRLRCTRWGTTKQSRDSLTRGLPLQLEP